MTYPADVDDWSPEAPALYARFSRRFYALVIDSGVYIGSLIVAAFLPEVIGGGQFLTGTLILLWFAFFLFYEPVLVSRYGASWGHRVANCRVIDLRKGSPPSFLRALGRFWVKSLVGIFAFVFMALTRRHQALHDLAFGTAVLIADPQRARPWHYAVERDVASLSVAVPAWRRILAIVTYSLIAFIAFALVLASVVSPDCLDFDTCMPAERLRETILSLAWLGLQAVVIVLGWKGRLFGARSRRAPHNLSPNPRAV